MVAATRKTRRVEPRVTNARGELISGPAAEGTPPTQERRFVTTPESRWGARRWEAAETTRLNNAIWKRAQERPINEDLSGHLVTLRERCEYEAANNAIIDGAIKTHQVDVIGEDGPTLQVEVLDDDWSEEQKREYAEGLEKVWADWFACPDAAGMRSGVEMLRQWVRQMCWTRGEFFEQLVTAPDVESPISMKLQAIATQRVKTPLSKIGNDDNVVMGVERDRFGRPLRYHVEKPHRTGDYTQFGPDSEIVPADQMLHGFIQQEPDQARGIPGLACNLDTIGHLREFEGFVLDAQKLAASTGVYLTTDHPDAPFVSVDTSVDVERNTQSTMPPGWKYNQLMPTQPSAQYVEYRRERHLEFGRPNSMPNLTLRADASNHNFSSAHFDSQGYQRANRVLHNRLGLHLKRLVMEVRREAYLIARGRRPDPRIPAVLAKEPKQIRILFRGWPTQTHVDPAKVRNGNETGLRTLQLAPSDVWSGDGHEFDKQLKKMEREFKRMADVEITEGLTLLDLFLAGIRPPNDPLANAVDEDGEQKQQKPMNTKTKPAGRELLHV